MILTKRTTIVSNMKFDTTIKKYLKSIGIKQNQREEN